MSSKEKEGQDTSTQEIILLDLSRITPDADQPRKYFAADRMHDLQESIKAHGLISPLVVEKKKDGTYQLVDGERRFRALTEIGWTKAPAIIMEEMNAHDRLIKQFHIQEQHEGWTGVEKAKAMKSLADMMGYSMPEMGKILGLAPGMIRSYTAFGGLLETKEFQKSEIPLSAAIHIQAIKLAARTSTEQILEKDFEVEDERALEKAVIQRIKDGELARSRDFARVVDSFKRDPKSVKSFIKTKQKVNEMYRETEAEAYTMYRRIVWQFGYLEGSIARMEKIKGLNLFKESPVAKAAAKRCAEAITNFARQIA